MRLIKFAETREFKGSKIVLVFQFRHYSGKIANLASWKGRFETKNQKDA